MYKSKSVIFKLLFLFYLALPTQVISQVDPLYLKFNTIDIFAPPGPYLDAIVKTTYEKSEIVLDFELATFSIKTYYTDGPVESTYKVIAVSELQDDNGEGSYFILTCEASNYAEVIIELNKEGNWVRRLITHNGIVHKYYTR